MATFKWKAENVPEDIKIKQVYGIVFNENMEIFLRIEDDGLYKLTGGKPEKR